MSTLHLVRHAETNARSELTQVRDERLTEVGEAQARACGTALADAGVAPRLLASGPSTGQRLTGSRMWEAAGWECPVDADPGWREIDYDAIVCAHKPAYRNTAVMRADLARHRHPRQARRELLDAALTRWMSGEHDDDYAESFPAFHDRVALALGRVLVNLDKDDHAVVVTSRGPASWVLASLLTSARRPERSREVVASLGGAIPPGTRATWLNLRAGSVYGGLSAVRIEHTMTPVVINATAHLPRA